MPLKCKYSKPAITIFILVVQGSVWDEQQEGAPQSRSLTKKSSVRNISTSTIHGPQEGLRQDLACSFIGNHGEVQHQCWPYLSHQTPLWQGHKCSPFQRQHRRLVPNNSWSLTGMSHPSSSTYFWKRSWETPQKIMKALWVLEAEQSPISTLLNDINGLAGEEEEQVKLVEHLNKASTAFGMEICAEKAKLMTNNTINKEIKVNRQKLETVTSFKYLGSAMTDEGSEPTSRLQRGNRTSTRTSRL